MSEKTIDESALPAVSIIIVNWNGLKYLETCLRALVQPALEDSEVVSCASLIDARRIIPGCGDGLEFLCRIPAQGENDR